MTAEQKILAWRPIGWTRWCSGAPSQATKLGRKGELEYAYTKAAPDPLVEVLAEALKDALAGISYPQGVGERMGLIGKLSSALAAYQSAKESAE